MARFDRALSALRDAQKDAEKEATRLEITQPVLAAEAREQADGLADARRVLEGMTDLAKALALLEKPGA